MSTTVFPPPPPPPSTGATVPTTPVPPDSSGARVAWIVVGSLLLTATLLWGTFNVVQLLAHEERTEITSLPADGVSVLDIATDEGSIRVVPSTDGTITVTEEISEGLEAPSRSVEVLGDRLVVRASCSEWRSMWCSVDVIVAAPSDVAVVARSDDGSVVVVGVQGSLELDSDNGSVRADGVTSADVVATTDNGSVSLVFDRAPTRVLADSDNGSVEIVVPDDGEAYAVRVATGNGSEQIQLPTDPSSTRSITATTSNGDVRLRTAG